MLGTDDLIGLGVVISLKDAFSAGAQRVIHKLEELEKSAMNSAGAVTRSLREMKTGMALFVAGAVGLGALNYATNRAAQFSSAIARVATVADSAQFSTEQLRQTAMGMSAAFGGGAAKQADALYFTLSTGIKDVAKATELLTIANKFAVGGVTDVTTATRGLAYVTAAYAEQNVSAARAADLLFKTSAAGLSTPEELAQQIGQVSSVASQAGVSIEELMAVIGRSTQVMTSENAIAGFGQMLANVANGDHFKRTKEEAQRLGIEFNSTHLRAVGFQRFLQEIITSPKFAADSLEKLFHSIEARRVVMALAAQNGAQFNSVLEEMKHAAGATDAAFNKIAGTSEYRMKLLSAAIDSALIRVGQTLEPVKAAIAGAIASIVEAFNRLPQPVITAVTYMGALASALAVAVGAFLLVKGAIILWPILFGDIAIGLGTIYLALAPLMPALLSLAAVGALLYVAWTRDFGGLASTVTGWYHQVADVVSALVALFTGSEGGVGQISAALHDKLVANGLWPVVSALYIFGERVRELLVGAWRGFVAALEMGAGILMVVVRVVGWLAKAVWFLVEPILELVGHLFNWSAGNEAASDTMTVLGSIVGFVVGSMVAYRAIVTLAAAATGLWRGVVLAATFAQWAFNLAMMANPIGLVIVGVTALIVAVGLLVKYWDEVSLAAARAWRWMKQAAGGDTSSIDATIARLEAKIVEADATRANSASGGFAGTPIPGALQVIAPPTMATASERAAAVGVPIAPQVVTAATPSAAPARVKRELHLNVNLSGRQIHRAVVDEDEAAEERTFGIVGP